VVAAGLKDALEGRARVHVGPAPPADGVPSSAIFDAGGVEGLSDALDRMREVNPEMSILVFSMHVDLPLARAALRLGARGFVHAGMELDQIARATEVAAKGEVVAPRKLLEFLIANDDPRDLDALTSRQRDILDMVAEGMSNIEIARRLYLSESTVKQHLRAAYKLLGVHNRSDAAKLVKGVY
jgi:DNA-binding NarL/FixJ family response regulator